MAVKKKRTTKKKVASKRGAPTKFDVKLLPVIKNLTKKGYIGSEIAELLGIDEKTYYNWKNKFPEYFLSEQEWKQNQNEELERALHKLAKGYVLPETKVFMTKDGSIKTRDVLKYLPPNEKAIEFALCNRIPGRWKNQSAIEHSIGEGMNKDFTLSYKQGDSKKNKPTDDKKE